MNEARRAVYDPEHMKVLWDDLVASDAQTTVFEFMGLIRRRLDGNVFLYEVRTALDEYEILNIDEAVTSTRVRHKIQDKNGA